MAEISLEPYIFFKGNAKQAMEFYKDVFGGELTMSTLGQSPKDVLEQMKIDESRYGEIMHASLKGPVNLMASDSQMASDHSAKVELSLGGTDEAQMKEIWEKLADGGKVKMPLAKQFWGDTFGMLTDKFGIDWNMNIGDNMGQ
ncbi:MAG TPA: VOC family protein [Candidatus Saccharimonadales bacterium]|nr:VOC family protein [Candidatus Saccharimonadales bacterium]